MKDKTIFFWQTNKGKTLDPGCFSQWARSYFVVDGKFYRYAEQFMMAEKARVSNDQETLAKIMAAKSPMIMKRLGRAVRNYDEKVWDAKRFDAVVKGNFAKFSQNDELKAYLLATDDALLVEASPKDRVWGIGLDAETAAQTPRSEWPGQNLLGQALMKVRDMLREGKGDGDSVRENKQLRARYVEEEAAQRIVNSEMSRARTRSGRSKAGAPRAVSASAGLPGVTRYSTVIGLMEAPTNRKWQLFLCEGPYWNYLVNYIQRKNIFRGRKDRVEEAVMNACERIGKFMMSKHYEYKEEGKGYFRAFIKRVAFRAALDLYREIARQEQMRANEKNEDARSELDKMKEIIDKATANRSKMLEKMREAQGIEDEIVPSSEHDLDVYDMSAGLNRNIAPVEKKQAREMHSIASLDDNPFADDEAPTNYNPSDMFDFQTKVSKEDLDWVQKLQIHVLYIALGYVLTNEDVSAERRELLRLRYGQDMKVKDIYALPRFASKNRGALDVLMNRATDVLRKEVASWWKLVAPSENDFANEAVMRCWRELGRADKRAKIAIKLQDKAIEKAGRIKE